MFRLADLYLDEADDEVDRQLAALEQRRPIRTSLTRPRSSPTTRSRCALGNILKEFPNYRQTPSTIYLLAYYGKTKDERRSLQLFLALACANRFKW